MIGHAQSVNMKLNNVPVRKAMTELRQQTGYSFVFESTNIDEKKRVNVNARDLKQAINQILAGQNVTYRINGKNIIISKAKPSSSDGITQTRKSNQKQHVTGTVLDKNGDPIIGATIREKGTNNATVTDIDGKFSIDVDAHSVLTCNYIGFKEQDINTNGKTSLSVTLTENNEQLDEVVVVGYGVQKKVNLTGSVSSISVNDMGNRPITNSSTLLQGTASGVYALQKSGQPGDDGANINIRGVGTLNNSDPLVLIDGFPGSMDDVDASEIESISVLKDAASASIYGNRAANGVILVTTKKGASGQASVSYSGYLGIQEATRLPKTLNSYQYVTLYNEACQNMGMANKYSDEEVAKYLAGDDPMYPNNDYFDIYYDPANIQNHRINVSGGSDNFQYAVMLGYLDQEGILVGTNYNKADFRANLDAYFLNKKLRFTTRLSGNYGNQKEPTDLWSAKWYATLAPIFPLKDEEGRWLAVNGERNYYGEIMEGSTSKRKRHTFNGQVEAEYKFLDGFSAQLTYGYNAEFTDNNAFSANVVLANTDGSTKSLASSLTLTNSTNRQTLLTALLRYDHTFGKHTVGAMVGYSEEYFDWKSHVGYRSGFINNTQRELNLGDASSQTNNSSHYDLGLQSVFGRINYNYDNKYLFEANLRRDGSSRFADGHKWGSFPSFSAGWNMTEEKFMKPTRKWLDLLKIRVSWGKLGNQNINSYYVGNDVLSVGRNYSFGGTLASGVAVTSLTNKETTWETTTQSDLGIDVNFSNGIWATLDMFIKKTDDILMQTPIPLTMGNLSAPYQNVGKVENKGIEFTIGYNKIFSNGIRLKTYANLSHINNEITDLNGASPIITSPKAQVEGYAINSFYGYVQDGIYQISDFTWQNNSDASIPYSERVYTLKDGVTRITNFTPQPGDIKYKDLDGDGLVDMDHDRKVIGKQFPDLSYAWSVNLEWKNFDFSMFWQGVAGIDGYTYYEIATCFSGFANLGNWWLDRWTPENPGNTYPRVTTDGVRNNIHSTFYMEDASYLRLKNIELGYTFDNKLIPALGKCKFHLYGSIQNLFTFTSYKGFDPEQVNDETRAEAYPQTRIYTIGLNINF
jgi:TonB-linked SusC/RagA family outer membrane protein